MQYHIILTKECNLNCNYCGGGSDSPPKEIQYLIADLKSFLSGDAAPVIEFYGGEPLLRIDTMKKIMDVIPGRFVIQTNGLLLDKIEGRYLQKFHSMLVSLDGTKEVTDGERSAGVYDRIMQNVNLIRRRGFCGDLVARMTVAQGTDIYENVRYLLDTGVFDHVHWQLSFEMFWEAWENTEPGLEDWINSYNSGVTLLVKWWVSEMESAGRVHGIVPFIGVMKSLLSGTCSRLRCGSGIDFFTIMPDGRISACPVSIDFDFSVIGSIFENTPRSLCDKAQVGEPCVSCDIFHICGGRCLFVNRSQEMLRENGYALICSTVRHLVRELQEALPRVKELIESGVVKRQDFEYPGFNNGCEIIP
ncbi:MAG: TIGR04084 family radical SAM/SPASM domain-containing protein [Candidatus Methanoperedens sp.]|nr:TIGR04084 family radical SAM/SPASM domain-containing protein [Candidatus Methanoperedens sp.]